MAILTTSYDEYGRLINKSKVQDNLHVIMRLKRIYNTEFYFNGKTSTVDRQFITHVEIHKSHVREWIYRRKMLQ